MNESIGNSLNLPNVTTYLLTQALSSSIVANYNAYPVRAITMTVQTVRQRNENLH